MKRRNRTRAVTAVLVAAVATGVLGAVPANADCLAAEVYYQRPGQTRQYVHGPQECVGPDTGWNQAIISDDPPVGEPSLILVGVNLWVPVP